MKHLADLARTVPRAPLAVSMGDLLLARKVALELEITTRHKAARATGTTANVARLSSALRATKTRLALLTRKRPHQLTQDRRLEA